MSVLQYPERVETSDIQIWDNVAFDNRGSEDLSSWSSLKFVNSFDSVSSKENQTPVFNNSSVYVKSPEPIKPLHPNDALEHSRLKSTKPISEQSLDNDAKTIDEEIEEIELEISRLKSRLEALRSEKVEKKTKTAEKRGRVVPAKFMEPKQSAKVTEEKKKIECTPSMSARTKVHRRGLSLGPSEILEGSRRGLSLGPSEIFSGMKSRQCGGKHEMLTPIQAIQNRRKSCFWKLEEIEEGSLSIEKDKDSSFSPLSTKTAARNLASRQAVTTVATTKFLKKDDVFLSLVQPKNLFRDGEKSVPVNKKPLRPARVVASRYKYNQSETHSSVVKKRSLPENDKDESERGDKKRSLSIGKSRVTQHENKILGTESRVKKR